ncbi:MAG: class I SAM-dependent methyltransferase [Candidatus Nanoarchaeia archaeon]
MSELKCNLCGYDKFKTFFKTSGDEEGVSFFPSSDVVGNDTLIKCKRCNLCFVHPILDENEILKEYAEYEDERFASQSKGRLITFGKNLKDIEGFTNPGRILDIGTANASFLYAAKKRGWKVEGVELNKYLIRWAKENYGLDIKQGTIFQHKFKEKFDVVSAWDVLEHVTDPMKYLNKFKELIKEDGFLVINYPDYKSYVSRLLGKKWPFYLSVHLFYFDRNTITKYLNTLGFKILQIKPHVQYLDLGYVFFRARKYVGLPAIIMEKIIKVVGLHKKQVPYWIGQTLIIAKKDGTKKSITY